ncbi:hypothetical protein [Clostridium botulinum]|uniref:hypothetical protein n=1 Tax=Clostridium botulinum TaxID=1491 RepID=UPI0004B33215|nr:hypothetical protein [Clostridium botulinum]APH21017.1 hypothetical protein NPD1_4084 [Clostridium botulinum]APQ71171.1 hypothetical protein RSJ8_4320 [Clostridium botulinum]MBN3379100.1 hypothetical protein [Clostridium botulinum]QDY26994.1 hypothetical protein CGQ40_20025 [Clostridium botulinum]
MLKRVCKKCGHKVIKSKLEEYPYQCNNCDEDLYTFETELIEKEKEVNELIVALKGLVGDTGLHENDCECDNTHVQNNTVCRYCYAREVLQKYDCITEKH